jgi:hypothetical protein
VGSDKIKEKRREVIGRRFIPEASRIFGHAGAWRIQPFVRTGS